MENYSIGGVSDSKNNHSANLLPYNNRQLNGKPSITAQKNYSNDNIEKALRRKVIMII